MTPDNEPFLAAGLRIFLVEDEFHVLLLLEDMLTDLGCKVVDTASTLSSALAKARTCDADAAILDVNLASQRVFPVAECLRQRGIPIIFSTGYGVAGMDPPWRSYPLLEKPYLPEQLAAALLGLRSA